MMSHSVNPQQREGPLQPEGRIGASPIPDKSEVAHRMPQASPDPTPRALRPRARILRTLGEELISNETVAVLELVKNSYDADARIVLIKFQDELQKGKGRLEIIDDGHGMDLSTVHTAWMEPATDVKKRARHSRYLNRRLLGEKGVGRFASARLAEELE